MIKGQMVCAFFCFKETNIANFRGEKEMAKRIKNMIIDLVDNSNPYPSVNNLIVSVGFSHMEVPFLRPE
jgi:hypothetical protein